MNFYDLPDDVPLRSISASAQQFRFAVGMTRRECGQAYKAGDIVPAKEQTFELPADVEIDEVTISQKNLAEALGLSRARINQLVKEGVLVLAPNGRKGRLMMFDSLSNYFQFRPGLDKKLE